VKRLFIVLLVVLALMGLAIAAGYVYLSAQDAEQIRRRAESGLESALGRDVTLSGPLKVSLTPLPAITISDVTIGNPAWASRPDMLTIEELRLVPDLLRLLIGDIELRYVRIDGAQLFLENGPDGQGNWQFKSSAPHARSDLPVHVRSLTITGLHAAYLNPAAPMTRELTLDSLSLDAIPDQNEVRLEANGHVLKQTLSVDGRLGKFSELMAGRPFPIEVKATVGDTNLSIDGKIDDPDFRDYKGIHLHLEATGRQPVVLMGWTRVQMPPLKSFSLAGDLDGDSGELGVTNLQCHLQSAGYDLTLSGSISDLPALKGLSITFKGSADSITQMLPWSDQQFTAKGQFTAAGHLSGDLSAPTLDAVSMSGQMPGVSVEIDGSVKDLHEGGIVDAAISVKAEGLAEVGRRLHVTLPDIDTAELDARLTGTLVAPALENVRATLTEGSLTAKVTGAISKLIPAVQTDLAIDLGGRDLADLGNVLGYEGVPQTDSVSAKGRLETADSVLDLTVNDGVLTRNDGTELRVSGTIDDIGAEPKLDLSMRLSGKDLTGISQAKAAGLPETDKYRIDGSLRGPVKAPDLVDVDAEAWLDKITVTVQGQFPDVLKFSRMDARIEVNGDDLSLLGKQFSQKWPESRSFNFGGRVHGSTSQPSLDDLQGRLGADEVDVRFSGRIGNAVGGKDFDLKVQASATSLAVFFPLGGHVWDALGKSDASFTIEGDIDSYHVNLAELHAGKSAFTGEFTYSRPAPDGPRRIEGAFRKSVLDLTPWLLGTGDSDTDTSSEKTADTPATQGFFPTTPFDLKWMTALELDVDLSAVELSAGQDRIELVHGELDLKDGALTLEPMQLSYEGAAIDGKFALAYAPTPRLTLQTVTRGLNFGQLAQRAGLSDDARGQIDMKVDLSAEGTSANAMAGSASGEVMMLMTNGFVGGKQLPLHVGEIFVHLMPWVKEQDGIVIKCGMLDLPLSAGIATVQLFVLDTKQMLMRGKGTIDLGKETYDLMLVPRAKHAKALAHNVDVRILGTLGHPQIRYDAASASVGALETVGRVALLGPAGLFLNPDYFRSQRQECASSLDDVQQIK